LVLFLLNGFSFSEIIQISRADGYSERDIIFLNCVQFKRSAFGSRPRSVRNNILTICLLFGPVCPSIEVRNGPQQFSELEGCRVVEGFLHIVLMENLDFATDLNNRSFPALREITGYLLFYRVFGLRSIGQLFPNLAVIRGQQLLFDFSFVVYELMQLQVRVSFLFF
jgi:hypothetical protein